MVAFRCGGRRTGSELCHTGQKPFSVQLQTWMSTPIFCLGVYRPGWSSAQTRRVATTASSVQRSRLAIKPSNPRSALVSQFHQWHACTRSRRPTSISSTSRSRGISKSSATRRAASTCNSVRRRLLKSRACTLASHSRLLHARHRFHPAQPRASLDVGFCARRDHRRVRAPVH